MALGWMGRGVLSLGIVLSACGAVRAQIVLGQVDTFQDGSLANWAGGDTRQNIPSGGPAGAGDRFLQINSNGGNGGGSRLATFNDNQWTGNYVAAGVTAISVHLRNQSALSLTLRIVLFDFSAGQTQFTSTVPVVLGPGSGWQLVRFSLAQADLTRVSGSLSYSTVMSGVDRLMIRHQTGAPGANGTPIAAELGIDNVRAVPEPGGLVVLGLGSWTALRGLRRKRTKSVENGSR